MRPRAMVRIGLAGVALVIACHAAVPAVLAAPTPAPKRRMLDAGPRGAGVRDAGRLTHVHELGSQRDDAGWTGPRDGLGGLGAIHGPEPEWVRTVPRGDISLAQLTMTVPVANADRVVAGLRGRFKSCYNRGLSEDPQQSGKAWFQVVVGPAGDVSSVALVNTSSVSAKVTGCVEKALMGATFDAPAGAVSVLTVGMNFVLHEPPDAGAAPSP